MINRTRRLWPRLGVEPYWYLIVPLLLGVVVLFISHLRTGTTPDRVFVHIAPLKFDVFWYGVCIVGGIALGTYVVSCLAAERGKRVLQQQVSKSRQRIPVASLALPEEIGQILTRRGIKTLGDLLLKWGYDRRSLGLNKEGLEELEAQLRKTPQVKEQWLEAAPWRIWNPDHAWNGVAWCLVLAVVGARLYHVLTPSPSMATVGIESPLDYFRNPLQLINLRNGGLGIYGGLAGGALGLFWFTRRQRLPMMAWADLSTVGVALGQVFGRWGNFFNQELYGRPSDLPWAIWIDPNHLLPGYPEGTRFHPAFLYESIWSFVTFILLLTLVKRSSPRIRTGDLTALYLVMYAIGRILLETIRLDSRMISLGDLRINLAVATLVSAAVAVMMIAWRAIARLRAQRD